MKLVVINASKYFSKLKGIKNPERKENYWQFIY